MYYLNSSGKRVYTLKVSYFIEQLIILRTASSFDKMFDQTTVLCAKYSFIASY